MSVIPLRFYCPGAKCPKIPTHWAHYVDGQHLSINTEGDIICPNNCKDSSTFIKDWQFKCTNSRHQGEFCKCSGSSLLSAIGNAAQSIEEHFSYTEAEQMLDFMMKIQEKLCQRWSEE